MRVLQVHTTYREAGGEDAVVAAEAALLRDGGHEVHTHVVANPTAVPQALAATAAAPWNPWAARRLRAAVAHLQPDVVHVHNTWFATSPAAVAALGDGSAAVVLTCHNWRLVCPAGTMHHHGRRCRDCLDGGPWRAVAHRCYRGSAPLSAVAAATTAMWRRGGAIDAVDRLIALTGSGRDLLALGGLPADRLVVRPHAVPDPGPRAAPPSASRTALFVGRAVPEKGLDDLLAWWCAAPRPLVLHVLGDGPALVTWRQRAPDGVVLRGAVPPGEVAEAMRTARALLVPSRWDEPFGLVAVEGMAHGLPVVSSGLGGLADIHGPDAGWTAPPAPDGAFDRAPWDRALAALLDDDEVDRRGAAARARFSASFDASAALASLESVYAEALAHRRARR